MAVQPRKIRARGANAKMRLAIAANYGDIPETGYVLLPFVSSAIGEERPLIADDTLGHGREMQDPTYDVATNTGDIVIPNDSRNLWYWLKMTFGPPTSTPSVAASGSLDFSAQPVVNSTVTINGVAVTFVAANAVGAQVVIGANLAATLAALQAMLAASATAGIASQTYAVDGTNLTITSKNLGVAGNSVALAASADSGAAPSGDTLTGGAVDHVFTSGAQDIPDAAIEIGHEDVGSFTTNFGAKVNQLKFAMQRSGLSTVTASMICQGETDPTDTSAEPDADDLGQLRFTNAGGSLLVDGVQTGNIKSGDCTISNELEPVDTIEEDGRIGGADPGNISNTGSMTVLYDSDDMASRARKGKPCEIQYKWKTPAGYALTIVFQRALAARQACSARRAPPRGASSPARSTRRRRFRSRDPGEARPGEGCRLMGLFGRLAGKQPPALPAGARAYVDGFGSLRDKFCVRARRPDEDGLGELVRGDFRTAAGAQMYAAWCNGEDTLDWDVNGAGMSA